MQVNDLSYTFPHQATAFFDRLNFELKSPGVNFLVGHNGAGKTTLADILTGLRPANGTDDLPKDAIYLNQRLPMLSSIRVSDVAQLILGIEMGRLRLDHDQLMGRLDARTAAFLTPIWQTRYGQLSGGQRKLVQLLLFLQINRSLVVLDEPTAAVDRENVTMMFDVMRAHPQRTYLVITHDVRDVTAFEDYQLLWLDHHRIQSFDRTAFETATTLPPFLTAFKAQ